MHRRRSPVGQGRDVRHERRLVRDELRGDRHIAKLIEEEVLNTDEDNIIIGKLLPGELAGSDQRERVLA